MAIAQMPKRKPAGDSENAAAKFIEGAPSGVHIAKAGKRTPVMIRFETALLARMDRAAKQRGVTRSAWVAFTLSKALDDDE